MKAALFSFAMRNSAASHKNQQSEKSQAMEGPRTSKSTLVIQPHSHQQQSSEIKSPMSSKGEPTNKDDLLCDDILSCISALDEVIAEFDDCSSLPYPLETESFASYLDSPGEKLESCGSPVTAAASSSPRVSTKSQATTRIQVGNSQSVTTPAMLNHSNSSQRSFHNSFIPTTVSNPSHIPSASKNLGSTKPQLHQQVSSNSKLARMPRGKEENYQVHKTSHLIHVSGSSPCSSSSNSSSSSSGGGRTGLSKPQRKSIPVASPNVNVNGGRRSSGGDEEIFSETDVHNNFGGGSGGGVPIKSGSDTYSKGTSYLLGNPKGNGPNPNNSKSIIHNNPFVGSSRNQNNNSISNGNISTNSQLTGSSNEATTIIVSGAGLSSGHDLGHRGTNGNHVSNRICNKSEEWKTNGMDEDGGGIPLSISGSVPKVKARGQVTTAMSVTQSHVQNSIRTIPTLGNCDRELDLEDSSVMKEQWNFPSEKNLPRSLRKTRKTCLLDEDEENGPPSSPGPGVNSQPWTRNNGKFTDDENEFSAPPVSRKNNLIGNNGGENCKGRNGRDDRWKIYEEVVVNQEASHSPQKINDHGVSISAGAKPQYFNAPLVLHIEDQCRNEKKTPTQPQQLLMRNKDSVSINIQSKGHKESEYENTKSADGNVTVGNGNAEIKTSIAYNISIHDLTKVTSPPTNEPDQMDVDHSNSASVVIINKSNGKSQGVTGTNGSCGSGRSSGRSSVNSDNNNSITVATVGGVCCQTNSNGKESKMMGKQVHGENHNKSVISMSMNGSGSSSGGSGIGMTRGRGQLINGKSGNGIGGVLACSASSSSSGGSASGSTAVLDVDDGYLSMINRNEAQLLWPDEMIENETFTADELKRISVNLGDDGEFQKENVASNRANDGSEEKMDYFSDDSLEFEQDGYAILDGSQSKRSHLSSQGIFSGLAMSMSGDKGMVYSAIPYNCGKERRVRSGFGGGGGGSSPGRFFNNAPSNSGIQLPKGNSPNNHLQYNVVSVVQEPNSEIEHKMQSDQGGGQEPSVQQPLKKPRHHYISRIPKISTAKSSELDIKGGQSGKSDSGSSGSGSGSCSPASNVSLRKPCSFFIPLTTETAAGGVTTIAEVKQPPRLIRQLTHELKVEKGSCVAIPPPSPSTSCFSDGQTLELCASAVDKHNASANPSCTKNIDTSSDTPPPSSSVRDTDTRHDFHQPNNSTFLSSTSSPDLSSSDTQPNTGIRDVSAESTDSHPHSTDLTSDLNSDFFPSPLSLSSLNHFVQEIMESALKTGLDEASINTDDSEQTPRLTNHDSHPCAGDGQLRLCGDSCEDISHTHRRVTVDEERRRIGGNDEEGAEGSCSAECGTATRTTPNSQETHIQLSEQSLSELSCARNAEVCQVRLQVDEIDEATEPEVDHDHRDKLEHRKNQIETVARLQAAVTTFFTSNENFFSESKRFPAGTPTPTDHSEHIIANNRSPSPLSLPSIGSDLSPLSPEFTDVPLMNSTRIALVLDSMSSPTDVEPENEACKRKSEGNQLEDNTSPVEISKDSHESQSSAVMTEPYSFIEDLNEQPPAFIPTPPPELEISSPQTKSTGHSEDSQRNSTDPASEPVRKEESPTLSHLDGSLPSPRLFNGSGGGNNKNIWPGYDRHFGGELLNVKPGNGKSISSRSQENLLDAVTKERLEKAFATRGQASTLPLNCRPPTAQRRANKHPEQTIPEVPELKDEEVQSITSRDSRKKPGFFSRLFRRSRKH